jgi:hypothetical protein
MSTKRQTSVIHELARTLNVPVRKINLRDPNVFRREQGDTAGNPENLAFREAVRFECESLSVEVRSNGSYLVLELKAFLDAGTWSINEPDQITLTRKVQLAAADDLGSLFAAGTKLSQKAEEIVHREAFRILLKKLDLGPHESLHFYKNAVTYYARSRSATQFLDHANAVCHFVAETARSRRAELRAVELPELFADLHECAQEWAISDDSERADALGSASAEALKKLIERVAPRLTSINLYLSTHSGEKEAALGSLAETVSEAQLLLNGTK